MSDRVTISLTRFFSTAKTVGRLFDFNIEPHNLYFTGIKYGGSGKGWITPTSCLSIMFPDQFKSPIVKQGFPDSACQSIQSYLISWSENDGTAFHKKWRAQAKESGTALLIIPELTYSIYN
jgi:hypothetical protein